jgi:hypothetical protein
MIPRFLRAPRVSGKRQKGKPALLGCDSVPNVLGPNLGVWSKPGEVEKHTEVSRAFRDLMAQAAQETGDAALF